MLMRAIDHLPYGIRLDSDRVTYAWFELALVTGFQGVYLKESRI